MGTLHGIGFAHSIGQHAIHTRWLARKRTRYVADAEEVGANHL